MQLLVRSTVLTPHYTLFQSVIVDNLVISNCLVVGDSRNVVTNQFWKITSGGLS